MKHSRKRKLLVFYPHNPFSPTYGSHLRCLQQFDDLGQDHHIIFASSTGTSDTVWPYGSLQALAREQGLARISIFERSLAGFILRLSSLLQKSAQRCFRWIRLGKAQIILHKVLFLCWFNFLALRHRPQAIIIHYTYWSFLSNILSGAVVKILELHDLLPISDYLQRLVIDHIDEKGRSMTKIGRAHV